MGNGCRCGGGVLESIVVVGDFAWRWGEVEIGLGEVVERLFRRRACRRVVKCIGGDYMVGLHLQRDICRPIWYLGEPSELRVNAIRFA